MSIWIQESWVNATEGYRIGDSDVYEVSDETPGDIYRAMLKCGEYGRCVSKVYIDRIDAKGKPITVGWVFQQRVKYDDCDETFLRETWVTLHVEGPRPAPRPRYLHIGAAE